MDKANALLISIHALREESDLPLHRLDIRAGIFQSTLSVRRATLDYSAAVGKAKISIHALREESDLLRELVAMARLISIHALREESDAANRELWRKNKISIHALREESDNGRQHSQPAPQDFNPRSP